MKKLTRKLFISVLVAVFAFVALGTSTYAWITINTTAEVQEFEATVDAGTAGIELSEDGTSWTTLLELKEYNPTNKLLDDLTTTDGIVFYNFVSEYNPTDEKTHMSIEGEEATSGYLEFTIQIRRTNVTDEEATTPVKIDGSKVKFSHAYDATYGTVKFTDANGDETESKGIYATNALRMSLTCGTTTVIYEQNASTDNNTTVINKTTGFAHAYAASQGVVIDGDPASYPTKQCQTVNDDVFLTLKGSEAQTITVRLWIEGWDNECQAKVLSQSFKVAFGFTI